jgi:hypothetical protein
VATDFLELVKQLRGEERKLEAKLTQVRQAIAALNAGGGGGTRRRSLGAEPSGPKRRRRRRKMSAEARAKISAAQKKRWAKQKGKS